MVDEVKHSMLTNRLLWIWATGLSLTAFFFFVANLIIYDRHKRAAQHEASIYIADLRSEVRFMIDALDGFANHLALTDDINCNSKNYSLAVIRNHPSLKALSRNSIVLDADRTQFELKQRTVDPDFQITESTSDGTVIPAKQRASYAVVTCIEPLEDNRRALGFDLFSEPIRAMTIENAIESGKIAVTPRIDLVQESDKAGGVLLIKSIISPLNGHVIGTASAVMSFKTFFGTESLSIPKFWSAALYDVQGQSQTALYVIAPKTSEMTAIILLENIVAFSVREWRVEMKFPLAVLVARTLAEPWSWIWLLVGVFGTWSSAQLFAQSKRLEAANRDIQIAAYAKLEAEKRVAVLNERENILSDLHDSIGANLTAIIGLLNRKSHSLEHLKSIATETLTELRLLVDTTQRANGDISLLMASVRYRMGAAIEQAGFRLLWEVADSLKVEGLSEKDEFSFKLILLEAISNAVHHSKGEQLLIRAHQTQSSSIEVTIKDDGCGFDSTVESQVPHGLKNMRNRARKLSVSANLLIQSEPGRGTTIRLLLPAPASSE